MASKHSKGPAGQSRRDPQRQQGTHSPPNKPGQHDDTPGNRMTPSEMEHFEEDVVQGEDRDRPERRSPRPPLPPPD